MTVLLFISGKREPDLTGGFSTYLKHKNISFNALFSFSFGNKMQLERFVWSPPDSGFLIRTRICPVNL